MKILVLAGGADQIALIKELKLRGHEVVLLDYFENPPAKPYADKHIVASTLDVEAVERYAKEERVSRSVWGYHAILTIKQDLMLQISPI